MKQIQFDDIEGLQEIVSEEWSEWSKPFDVPQSLIDQFADLTGDYTFIHVDPEAAAKTPFKTTIAHGFLTLSLMTQLKVPTSYEVIGFQTIINYGSNKLRFTGAVPSGSSIHMHSRVNTIIANPKGSGTQLTMELAIHVVGQDRPALIYEMILLYI